MTYPLQNLYKVELEYEEDLNKSRELYPVEVAELQRMVENRLDELEGEGGRIYDENPDRYMIQKELEKLYSQVDQMKMDTRMDKIDPMDMDDYNKRTLESEEVSSKSYFPQTPQFLIQENQLQMLSCRTCNSSRGLLYQLVDVLFANELYRRRCRYRRNRRWW